MHIPFVDLHAQYLSIQGEIDAAIADVIKNTAFIGGERVKKFEASFAELIGVKHCVAAANGTDTLEILMQAYNIGAGDEVIIPSHSWMSTAEIIITAGATPVFVDMHPEYYTINVNKIEEKITANTKAIIPVHLCGLPAEMDEIMAIANKYNLIVIEDCAQSHISEYKGKITGTFGHAASFSFYPGKNLGAYGDAGALITNDEDIAQKCRMIANHGQLKKHTHLMAGRNSRLDGMQAAILNAKIPHLAEWTSKRIEKAAYYDEAFAKIGIQTPKKPDYTKHVYHLYMIRIDKRSELMVYLKQKGIETAVHYPVSMPLMPAFENLGGRAEDYPVNMSYIDNILSIPIFPEITVEQMQYVVDTIADFFNS